MNTSSLTRHKSLYLSGLIALIILGIGAFVNFSDSSSKNKKKGDSTFSISSSTSTGELSTLDTDLDGLPDWEEAVYTSDTQNKDTDNDGTSDGDEVKVGRNPVIANISPQGKSPTDLLPVLQDPTFSTSSAKMSAEKKEFLIKYLNSAGREIRETTYRDLVTKFDAKKFKPRRQLVDLKITSDNSDADLKRFLNEFGAVILRYKTPSAPRSETDILSDYAKTQDPQLLKDLHLNTMGYLNLAKDLRAIPTPSGVAKIYLSLVVGYEGMALGLSGLEQLKSNPVNASGGYQGYMVYQTQVADGYAAFVYEVMQRGIIFTKDESGYMFYANVFTPSN